MSAMQAGLVRLLAPKQTWGEMKGYPCLYSHYTMQSTSPRRPQIEHACRRALSAAQAVDSRLCRESCAQSCHLPSYGYLGYCLVHLRGTQAQPAGSI